MNIKNSQSNDDLLKYLHNLEHRIINLENKLGINTVAEDELPFRTKTHETEDQQSSDLEFKLGSLWFAKFGIIILAAGIILLLTLPLEQFPSYVPSTAGFIISAMLFVSSRLFKDSFSFLSKYLFGSSLLLIFFSTMRLHYFSDAPAIESKLLVIILLTAVVTINLIFSVRRSSTYLAGINIVFALMTALLSGNGYFVFLLITILSITISHLYIKNSWSGLLSLSIVSAYFTHFLWAINNPLLGNKLALTSNNNFNVFFIIVYLIIFAGAHYLKPKDTKEDGLTITNTFLNVSGGYFLFLLIVFKTLHTDLSLFNLITAIVLLIIAILFWVKFNSVYATFLYAIFGYTALSVSILAQFEMSDSFVVLSWQSLLVITTAIWFRSKIIILANFMIYLILFLAFLILVGDVTLISVSFGIIALLSARILNWQKERLNLKTEMMRNAYLFCAFIIIPYSIYMSIPKDYVIVSWLIISMLYYVLGALLNNVKYRWMGNATLILTMFYALFVGTVELNPVYRVISFLLVGLVLITVSIIYTKYRDKMKL